MDGGDGRRVVLYKRWRLLAGTTVEQLHTIVVDQIVPTYRRLSDAVQLGLEVTDDGQAILAIQRWRSRAALDEAMRGPAFDRWWAAYQPTLATWYGLVELDAEWESVELL